jgi:hypothetical protein
MPRADRLSLTLGRLAMPAVDHLSNMGTLNVLLDRTFSGLPSGLPPDRTMVGLFMNFSRLTDKLEFRDLGRSCGGGFPGQERVGEFGIGGLTRRSVLIFGEHGAAECGQHV